jgi:hypothetical protein
MENTLSIVIHLELCEQSNKSLVAAIRQKQQQSFT